MRCAKCSRPVDVPRWKTCARCREQAKGYARRRRGWDGVSPWVPARIRRPSQSIPVRIALEDVAELKRLVQRDGGSLSGLIREAVMSYLGEISERGAA